MSRELAPERLVILKAIKEIEKRGWCQGKYLDKDGAVCASAAIYLAAGTEFDSERSIFRYDIEKEFNKVLANKALDLMTAVIRHYSVSSSIPAWNDAHSKDEVLEMMNLAVTHGL